MNVQQYIQLADGTYAVITRSIDWGQVVIILLLVALVFVKVYEVWRQP